MPIWLLILQYAAVPVLIGLNAFFVAAEYAIVTIRSSKIEEMRQAGKRAAPILARLKEDIEDALATIQICITGTNLLIGSVAEPAVTVLILKLLSPLGFVLPTSVARPIALVLSLTIVTFFTVVLSELLPKALTLQYTEKIAVKIARPIDILRVLTTPLVIMMNWTANMITRAAGMGDIAIEEPVPSEDELEIMVDRAGEAGEFHEEHGELLRRAFDFADLTVRQIMIDIKDAGVMDSNGSVEDLAQRLAERPYTRWPLRDPATGQINGIVNVKMALFASALSAPNEAIILHDLATRPTFLNSEMALVDALNLMRRERAHIAVVVDHDGQSCGIVTLEDMLASLVGRIPSESRRFIFFRPRRRR